MGAVSVGQGIFRCLLQQRGHGCKSLVDIGLELLRAVAANHGRAVAHARLRKEVVQIGFGQHGLHIKVVVAQQKIDKLRDIGIGNPIDVHRFYRLPKQRHLGVLVGQQQPIGGQLAQSRGS